MASSSSKHLVVSLLVFVLLFSLSVAGLHEDLGHKKEGEKAKGCHLAGRCGSRADCRQPCAALGRNPYAVKCVSFPGGGNHCCCIDS
ncbi:hypothetical protein COLO4_10769 [Corchorus olitorius]|uniref:Uncharacterized protein n=1 Tax=Corchorus olitorius TaxID=93759 RepID=A0A1R3K791_9ROSI|nr:hypothetical protein COLO4_10769 [Corchorus olitorius]